MKFTSLFKRKNKLETYRSMRNSALIMINTQADLNNLITGASEKNNEPKIEVKPIEIWEKLKSEKPNLDCTLLDEKIKIVKNRINVIEQNMRDIPTDEYEVMGYLEARKKYKQYASLFKWPITTEEKITELCRVYAVELETLEHWYTLIPDEGIQEMNQYREVCKKIRPEKPIFRLIVPVKSYEEKGERRRDPILLASSPFGRWDYILGAWDKEVAIVDE